MRFFDDKFNILIYYLSILFFHSMYDIHIEGILSRLKSKDWWNNTLSDNDEETKKYYSKHYKKALKVHCFEWTCFIHIPIIFYIYYLNIIVDWKLMLLSLVINYLFHYITDNIIEEMNELTQTKQPIFYIQCIFTATLWLKFILLK